MTVVVAGMVMDLIGPAPERETSEPAPLVLVEHGDDPAGPRLPAQEPVESREATVARLRRISRNVAKGTSRRVK